MPPFLGRDGLLGGLELRVGAELVGGLPEALFDFVVVGGPGCTSLSSFADALCLVLGTSGRPMESAARRWVSDRMSARLVVA